MAFLTMDRLTDQIGTPDIVVPQLLSYPVEANTIIYAGALVALNAAGNAVPCSASSALRCVGRCEKDAPNRTTDPSGGAAGAIQVQVRMGAFYYDSGTGADAITVAQMQLCFASDDHTANATDAGGTRPAIGPVFQISLQGQVGVLVGFPSLYQVNPGASTGSSAAFVARAVATSIAAYTGTGTGVLTASANGAIGAQDGVTLLANDVIFLPHGLANVQNADVGPFVVTSLGGASAKFVLTRPDWYVHGAAIPLSAEIKIGPEGTVWKGSTWKATATGTIDTTDALFYPIQLKGVGAVGTQVTGLYVLAGAAVSAMDTTANHSVQPTLVAGNGTGTLDFTGTGTDAINYAIFNF